MTEYQNKWYQENKDRILKERKDNYDLDPEKFKNKSLTYYHVNNEEIKIKRKIVRVRDKEKLSEASKLRYQSMTYEEKIIRRVKERVRKQNIPFDITTEDIQIPSHCPVLGIPLFISDVAGPNTPSIDRVINDLGYTKGNIRIISMKANSMKGAMSVNECEQILLYLKGFI